MNNPTKTTYMASFPKRNDITITGAPDQVFKFDNLLNCLMGGIKANTIAAIGTINPGSLFLQYHFVPQIHYDLSDEPIAFIGNSTNKKGKFSMIRINVESPLLHIKDKSTWDTNLTHGDAIPTDLLANTDWNNFEDPIVGTLIPNFSLLFSGKTYLMEISVMKRSWQSSLVWVQDTNFGLILPRVPSIMLMTFLPSWKRSRSQRRSSNIWIQPEMTSPFNSP